MGALTVRKALGLTFLGVALCSLSGNLTMMKRITYSQRQTQQEVDFSVLPSMPSSSNNNSNDTGWHDIHVFYGDGKHLDKRGRSQCGQDDVVIGLLNQKRRGYFVDLAANDAVQLSNTYKLEMNHDWSGLCVEPNPQYWRGLSYRKCQVVAAVVGKYRMEEIRFKMHSGLGRAPSGGIEHEDFDNDPKRPKSNDPSVSLYTVPLVQVLERFQAPHKIDYLSLDVEGAEYYVMKDFPFDRYTISILSIERPRQELVDLLYANKYRYLAGNNAWGEETFWAHASIQSSLNMTALSSWVFGDTKWLVVGNKTDALDQPPPPTVRNKM